MSEVKPCPCCGHTANGWISKIDWHNEPIAYKVQCLVCSLQVEVDLEVSGYQEIDECEIAAKDIWNTRIIHENQNSQSVNDVLED